MIAQEDDLHLFEWIHDANAKAGGFLASLADAALRADHQNYPILRPVLLVFQAKYPQYGRGKDRTMQA